MTNEQKIDATLRVAVTIDKDTATATFDCQVCDQKVTHPFPVALNANPGDGMKIILSHLLVIDGPGTQCPTVKRDNLEGAVTAIGAKR